MITHEAFFEHLKTRSLTSLIYRRLWLYPRLSRYLSGRILDIGCGLGDFLAFNPNTIGVDVNSKAVEWCRARGLNAYMMQVDVIPFNDGYFSGVVLDNVLEHLSKPDPLLVEIRRVLTTGGQLLIGVPGKRGHDTAPDHKVFYDKGLLTQKIEGFGFTCQKYFYMPVESVWLDHYMPQYCLYCVFSKMKSI